MSRRRISRLALAASLCAVAACHRSESAAEKEPPAHSATSEKAAPSGVTIAPDLQARAGIVTAAVEATEFEPGLAAYGRVLDPTPLLQAVSDLATARATSDASQRELSRIESLNTDQPNVAQRTVESARATAQRDLLATDLAASKIVAAWGPALANRSDLAEFSQALVHRQAALIRIDLPPDHRISEPPKTIRVALAGNDAARWTAAFAGFAADADPQTQSQSLFATIEQNPPAPNLTLIARLGSDAPPLQGVRLPRSAVVHYGDGTFVYLRSAPDRFVRQAVQVQNGLGEKDWFCAEGLNPGDRVAVAGVQEILSEELKGSAAPED